VIETWAVAYDTVSRTIILLQASMRTLSLSRGMSDRFAGGRHSTAPGARWQGNRVNEESRSPAKAGVQSLAYYVAKRLQFVWV
jgi:hypothetical protein